MKIHQDIDSRYSVAIHWGTFAMADEPVDEPPKLLEDALTQKGISNEHFLLCSMEKSDLSNSSSANPGCLRFKDSSKFVTCFEGMLNLQISFVFRDHPLGF